ncbi:MAG: hypothetical protein KAS12_01205 [Candidatus Aenigmarchaeota archaeon]|nr:hypothetical protein [Candidatus Aenigmarchaeota archaeon]
MAQTDQTIEEKYSVFTPLEHAKQKEMWMGTSQSIENEGWYLISPDSVESGNNMMTKETLAFSPAWYKCIDEIIVNASDHWFKYRSSTNPVTCIKISISDIGEIAIWNDGPGFEVVKHKEMGIYIPELLTSRFFSGTNLQKDDENRKGGTNGLGIKLVNANSQKLTIETVDPERHLKYVQVFEDRLDKIGPPIITKSNAKSYTKITFLPCYKELGFSNPIEDDIEILTTIIRTRAYQIAAYVESAKVIFNGNLIKINSLADYAKKFNHFDAQIGTVLNNGSDKLQFIIGVRPGTFEHLSIINGVQVSNGTHITYFNRILTSKLEPKVSKLFKNKINFQRHYINDNIFMFIMGTVPGAKWDGQRKDKLSVHQDKFKGYTLDDKFVDKIYKAMKGTIMNHILISQVEKSKPAKKLPLDKYRKANKAGRKYGRKCSLFLPEGDSAESMVRIGITSTKTKLNFDYYGIFNLQGVIMNARKQIKEVNYNGQNHIIQCDRLKKNIVLQGLVQAIGLNYTESYESNESLGSLNYGCVIATTDQDLDGVGNIFGLLVNFFDLFWPNLLYKHGFVRRFITPIIRAFPKAKGGKIKEFYLESECEKWRQNDDEAIKYDLKFYKGLAGHGKEMTVHMFQEFERLVYIYFGEKNSRSLFQSFFGHDTADRKVILRTPVQHLSSERENEIKQTLQVSCTEQLMVETKSYQLDNVSRKLPHTIDGFNVARRKIFCGVRKYNKSSNKEGKVYQVGGFIAQKMGYHHGSDSLNSTITKMAQNFLGAQHFPLLQALGVFGTRVMGGDDKGSPRYISTRLNRCIADALFPPADDYSLKYIFEDGERCQPAYYVPIVPMAILESYSVPATAWRSCVFARDFNITLQNVRNMINDKKPNYMPISANGFRGSFRVIGHSTYCVGCYEYNSNTGKLIITELPIFMWTKKYMEYLDKKELIRSYKDMSSDCDVRVEIKIGAESMKKIQSSFGNNIIDPIEDYFGISSVFHDFLNMISIDDSVAEYQNYVDILYTWFDERKGQYERRITRNIVITKIKIEYFKNIIAFIEIYNNLKISKMANKDVIALLEKNLLQKFDKTLVVNPGYIKAEELWSLCLHGPKSDYGYLLDLTARSLSKESILAFEEKLNAELDKLETYSIDEKFIGEREWSAELDKLENVVLEGKKTGWLFGDQIRMNFE